MAMEEKKDRVCGMDLDDCSTSFEHKGKTYCFCSEGCKEQFKKSPERFLK